MMHQTSIDFDVCASRHHGNEQSVAAHHDTTIQRQRVLEAIKAAGANGITCDELSAKWGVGQNSISGRFSSLSHDLMIRKISTRPTRSGKQAAVYVAN